MLTNLANTEIVKVPGERLYETEIRAKYLDTLQVKTLQRLSVLGDVKGIVRLLGENLNIDINTMFLDDFKYLIHWFRLKSFANFPHIVGFTCDKCNTHQELPVKSENLMIKDVPEDLTKGGGLRISLENYPNGLFIRAPKVGDDFIADKLMQKYELPEDDLDIKSILLDLNLFRNKENGMDIEQLYQDFKLSKFTPDDLMTITAFKMYYNWGVEDTYKFTCEHCKEEVIVQEPLDITTFFQPSESIRYIRNRILPSVPSETTSGVS